MGKKHRFKTKIYLIILGFLLLRLVLSYALFMTVGMDNAPSGGLDSIGDAIAYVWLWELFAVYIPVAEILGVTLVWLFMSHRKVFIVILAGAVTVVAGWLAYDNIIRRFIMTPGRAAQKVRPYEEWFEEESGSYRFSSFDYTDEDFICEYAEEVISDAYYVFADLHPDGDDELKEEYFDAALEKAFRDTSYVTGWEYVPDVDGIVTQTTVGLDTGALSEHYGRPLNNDHYFNRYGDLMANGLYHDSSLMVVFYEDGTMDLVNAL
ncbi:MAG: hypothetical protein IKG01_03715 [Lachnospiraceae bacterium]|nr:hypothetical protein [Lachnospiraceae bacterium]